MFNHHQCFSFFFPNNITKTLQHNTSAKLLGIMIQNNLKHHQTITNIIKNLQPIIQELRYITKFVPINTMKQQYYSRAYPHLIGNITLWGTRDHNKMYIQPLIRIHKRIIRIIMNLPPRTHTKPLMKKLGILNIPNLYIFRTCIEKHPFIHTPDKYNRPEHNHNYIWIAQVHEHNTRYSQQQHHYIPNPKAHEKST